jgi:hypothetical protein
MIASATDIAEINTAVRNIRLQDIDEGKEF